MAEAMKCAEKNEEAPLGKQILEQLQENLKIAGEDMDMQNCRRVILCILTDQRITFRN